MPYGPDIPYQPGLPGELGQRESLPRAARLQRRIGEPDQVLTDLARRKHGTVAWWWGVRRTRGKMGAHCHICNQQIVKGALNVRITATQQDVIEAHRLGHWNRRLQILAGD